MIQKYAWIVFTVILLGLQLKDTLHRIFGH